LARTSNAQKNTPPDAELKIIAGTRLGNGLMAPFINRRAISAAYRDANEKQIQALLKYEQTVLQAYLEVVNEQWNLRNLQQQVSYKTIQVERLNTSVEIANILFASARADYIEVLLTQEEALDTRFELAATKLEQLKAQVQMYRALGGGWR
jgi:multidrug efflux system outer membrane protein